MTVTKTDYVVDRLEDDRGGRGLFTAADVSGVLRPPAAPGPRWGTVQTANITPAEDDERYDKKEGAS